MFIEVSADGFYVIRDFSVSPRGEIPKKSLYIHLFLIYMCVCFFTPSRGQPLCFSLQINYIYILIFSI